MVVSAKKTARALAATAAVVGALSLSVVPGTANAQGWRGGGWQGGHWHHHNGISPGAAVGLGLGAFALGSALGASAAYPYYGYSNPYYGYSYPYYGGGYAYPYGYGYGY